MVLDHTKKGFGFLGFSWGTPGREKKRGREHKESEGERAERREIKKASGR